MNHRAFINSGRAGIYLLASFFFVLLPAPAWACFCGGSPLGFCQAMPDVGDASHAVFVGKVVEFFPKSREQWSERMDEFGRTHQDLRDSLMAQLQDDPSARVAGGDSINLTWRKALIEDVWADSLNAVELQQLRGTTTMTQLNRFDFDYRRRVRLEVQENFGGADQAQFTLFTKLDDSACGFDFVEGETYLVDAFTDPVTGTWHTTKCSRTQSLSRATQAMDLLRLQKTGNRLPGYIVGLIDSRLLSNGVTFQIRLRGGNEVFETTSDSSGHFRFENLDPDVYQLEIVELPALRRPVDLTHNWCAFVVMHL